MVPAHLSARRLSCAYLSAMIALPQSLKIAGFIAVRMLFHLALACPHQLKVSVLVRWSAACSQKAHMTTRRRILLVGQELQATTGNCFPLAPFL